MQASPRVAALSLVLVFLACGGESDGEDESAGGSGGVSSGGAGRGGTSPGGTGGAAGSAGNGAGNGAAGSAGRAGSGSGGDPDAGEGGAGNAASGGAGLGNSGGTGGGEMSAGASGEDGAGGAASGLVSCDPRLIMCRRAAPVCGTFEVPSVSGTCYGPCVPIERCECDEPAQCPNEETYTCNRSAGRCTPYLR